MSQLQTNLKSLQIILDKINNLPPANYNSKMIPVEIIINHDGTFSRSCAMDIMFHTFNTETHEVQQDNSYQYLPDNDTLSLSYNVIAETIMVIISYEDEARIKSYEMEFADPIYQNSHILVVCIDPYDSAGNLVDKKQIKINM